MESNIKSIRNHAYDDDGDIKSMMEMNIKPPQSYKISPSSVYYNSLSTERMIENGETKYDSRIETDYDGSKGHLVVDINGKHFEKEFDKKDLKLFINNQMNSSYSSIDELKANYGISNNKPKAKAKTKTVKKVAAKKTKASEKKVKETKKKTSKKSKTTK
jgi:hypothetical protein